jgi:hypothetical protein
LAARERSLFDRPLAAWCACFESAECDAALRGMRFNARSDARDRVADFARAADRPPVRAVDWPLERLVDPPLERLVDPPRECADARPPARDRALLELRLDRRCDRRDGSSPPGSGMPARRASDSPMAMACFGLFAAPFPSRSCPISFFTNSPAAVVAAFPRRRTRRARSMTFRSGMAFSSLRVPAEQGKRRAAAGATWLGSDASRARAQAHPPGGAAPMSLGSRGGGRSCTFFRLGRFVVRRGASLTGRPRAAEA